MTVKARPLPALGLALVLWIAASGLPASGHGASEGLHLHVRPDPARPGGTVAVRVNSAEPVVRVEIGFAGHEAREVRLRKPRRRRHVRLEVPDDGEATASLQAEALTEGGEVVRASAIVRLRTR